MVRSLSVNRRALSAALSAATLLCAMSPAFAGGADGVSQQSADKSATPSADDDDYDFALQAVRDGKALPLSQLQEIVSARYPGDIINIGITRKHDKLLYEFKVLQPSGRLTEIEMNARTGNVEEVENE